MSRQFELSDEECELVVGLLTTEAAELSSEIRRTDTARVRRDLVAREAMVRDLQRRFRSGVAVTA